MKPDTEFDLIMKPKMKQSALRRWRLILEQGGHGNGVKGASGSNHVLSLHVGAGITGVHMRPSLSCSHDAVLFCMGILLQ